MTLSPAEITARARAGDPLALTEVGKRLLVGPPEGRIKAIAALDAAASKGSGEAAALVGVLAGVGSLTQQSWPIALDYTARAAALGWKPAQEQLLLLSHEGAVDSSSEAPPAGPQAWQALARRIDLKRWLEPPQRRPLSEAPQAWAINGFLPESACRWLIERMRGELKPAQVYSTEAAAPQTVSHRSNSAAEFSTLQADLILVLVHARIAAATGYPTAAFEPTQILHYGPGQEFRPHFDFLDADKPSMSKAVSAAGQRAMTFLVYLNGDFEGGETEFVRANIRYKGGTGGAVFWSNLDADGRPDRMTLHAGRPPASGEKWLLSQWIRDRAPGLATA